MEIFEGQASWVTVLNHVVALAFFLSGFAAILLTGRWADENYFDFKNKKPESLDSVLAVSVSSVLPLVSLIVSVAGLGYLVTGVVLWLFLLVLSVASSALTVVINNRIHRDLPESSRFGWTSIQIAFASACIYLILVHAAPAPQEISYPEMTVEKQMEKVYGASFVSGDEYDSEFVVRFSENGETAKCSGAKVNNSERRIEGGVVREYILLCNGVEPARKQSGQQ